MAVCLRFDLWQCAPPWRGRGFEDSWSHTIKAASLNVHLVGSPCKQTQGMGSPGFHSQGGQAFSSLANQGYDQGGLGGVGGGAHTGGFTPIQQKVMAVKHSHELVPPIPGYQPGFPACPLLVDILNHERKPGGRLSWVFRYLFGMLVCKTLSSLNPLRPPLVKWPLMARAGEAGVG